MKRFAIFGLALVVLAGCDSSANREEAVAVDRQQEVYRKSQPVPFFDYSLQRDLWIQFYVAQNANVATYSYITPQNTGQVLFETPSIGYPIPMDTQLTNPQARVPHLESVLPQAEPNGLYTSPNTDATIIMAANDDGTVSPIYTEMKVTTFPFEVKWDGTKWVRVQGGKTNISLKVKK